MLDRGECGLSGAAQPEEDGDLAVLVLVGGGVQAELPLQRHVVHHQSEDALLHLARCDTSGIGRAVSRQRWQRGRRQQSIPLLSP